MKAVVSTVAVCLLAQQVQGFLAPVPLLATPRSFTNLETRARTLACSRTVASASAHRLCMQLDADGQRRTGKRAAVRRFVSRIVRRRSADELDHDSGIEAHLQVQQRGRRAAWRNVAVSLAAAVAMRTCFAPRIAHAAAKTATPDTVLVEDLDDDDEYGYDRSLYSLDEDLEEQTTPTTSIKKGGAAASVASSSTVPVTEADEKAAAVAARKAKYAARRKTASIVLPIVFLSLTFWKANQISSRTMREQRKRVRVENTKFNQ
eukprot:16908-Heterococcus_DN1.PRE.1